MAQEKNRHHLIDYIEFPVTDIESSKKFFSSVFGWEFTDYSPEYVGIKKPGGGEIGGFSFVDSVSTGGPLVVIYSDTLNASYKKVVEAGGQITKEIFEFPGGQRFEFKDPSGNGLAVWSGI